MVARISGRDFLNGVAIGTGAGLLAPAELFARGDSISLRTASPSADYPPALTGMRGSDEGSFEVAHALAWRGEKPAEYRLAAELARNSGDADVE